MSMAVKVRMKKDWQFSKAGDVVEVFAPVAKQWVFNGLAEYAEPPEADRPHEPVPAPAPEGRQEEGDVEAAVDSSTSIETASVKQQPRRR